jgi:hypothetical protein
MGDGRTTKAPCGHLGEVVIGTYVQCLRCDKQAVPKPIRPEKTEPMRLPRCPNQDCESADIEQFDDDIDAMTWFLQNYRIPSSSPTAPQEDEWGCNSCGKVFTTPT